MRRIIGQTYFEVVQKLPLSTMGKQFLGEGEGGTRNMSLDENPDIFRREPVSCPYRSKKSHRLLQLYNPVLNYMSITCY
jgi:hypothetical protein